MNEQVKSEPGSRYGGTRGSAATGEKPAKTTETCLQDLQALSHRGLRDLFLFLLFSFFFFGVRQIDLLAPLTEGVRRILGSPPSPELTTLALTGYTLSALVLILARTARGERPRLKWVHLFYRTVFYFFYAVAGSLEGHFMEVLLAGLLLIGLEQLNIWTYALKALPSGKELTNKS